MAVRRDSRGTLRDYSRELKREPLSILFSFLQSPKISSMAFTTTSFLKPNGNSPWGCFTTLNKTDSTHPASSIPATECFGVMTVFFWGDKSEIFPSVIESISIYMVNKSPTVFRFSYDMIMNEVVAKSGISVITFIELYSDKLLLINIFIKNSIAYKIMSHIVQWYSNDVPIVYSVIDNPIFVDWRQGCFTPASLPIIVKPTKTLGNVWSVASFDSTFHNYIISKNNKISRRING